MTRLVDFSSCLYKLSAVCYFTQLQHLCACPFRVCVCVSERARQVVESESATAVDVLGRGRRGRRTGGGPGGGAGGGRRGRGRNERQRASGGEFQVVDERVQRASRAGDGLAGGTRVPRRPRHAADATRTARRVQARPHHRPRARSLPVRITRPRRCIVHARGLLLQMQRGQGGSFFVLVTTLSPQKTAEPIEVPFGVGLG